MGNKYYRIAIITTSFLFTLGIFGWGNPLQIPQARAIGLGTGSPTSTTQPTAEPTDEPTAEPTAEPTGEPTTEPTAEPTAEPTTEPGEGTIVEVVGPSEVNEGESFSIEVIASNIPDPGLFGFQFQLSWDDTVFSLVADSAELNADFPVVAKFDIGEAGIQTAASRGGDVADLTGPLTLLSAEFQANVTTDPDVSTLSLSGVKLGRKGGLNVPVDQVIDLDVVVIQGEPTATPEPTDEPTATPEPTDEPTATPEPTDEPTATPEPTDEPTATPEPTDEPTATPEPTDSGIVGNVKVQGRADDNQAGHSVQDETDLFTLTDTNGDFSFPDAEFGTYTLTANSAGFLAATCTDVDHSSDPTVLESVILLAGDLDDSGEVDITDAVAIGTVFGSTEPDEIADLNVDGEVDILDLILMSVNFGQTSAGNPWVCQP